MGRTVTTETVVLWACAGFIAVAGIAPIVMMVADSLLQNGYVTLDYYREVISTSRFWSLLGNSAQLALGVTVACGVVGVPTGVLLAKSDLPLRSLFFGVLTVPFVLPPYFLALGWVRFLARLGWFGSSWLFGFGGCVLVLTSVFLPMTILLTMASCWSVDRRLEEAARIVSGWPRVLRKVTLPLATPGIVFSLVLVFLLSIGEFSVPNFLRYPVLPALSFTQFAASYNFGAATAAAVPLLLIALIGVFTEVGIIKGNVYASRRAGPTLIVPLERWKAAAITVLSVLCCTLVVLPLGALFADAFSTDAFSEAIQRGGASILRSVTYSSVAATILVSLGFLFGHFMLTRGRETLNVLTLALFAIPGTVLSVGLVRVWNTPFTSFVYTTPAVLILGYVAQYCAVTTRLSLAGLLLIPVSFHEAAQICGASWMRRLSRISVPLAKKTLVCSWLAAYILCLRDVPIALMTAPPGYDPLPARILTLMANGAAPMISALCVIMAGASLIPLLILTRSLSSTGTSR